MRSSSSHRVLVFVAGVALVFATAWFVHRRITVTLTPSLGHSLFYLEDKSGDDIRTGDYVMFRLDDEITRGLRFDSVTKEVVCAGGERLSVVARDYYCNGSYLGRAKETSLKGEKVMNFTFNGIIPAGALFVMGRSKDSYDSRYFGFVRVKDVEKIAYPLF